MSDRQDLTESFPSVLYKYRRWSETPRVHGCDSDSQLCLLHRRLLTHNEIYFSKPSDFNDPFDCHIVYRNSGGSAGQKFKRLLEHALTVWPNKTAQERRDIVRKRVLELQMIERDPRRRKEEEHRQHQEMDEGYGIYSLSAEPASLPMWAHYADENRGLCIGLWTEVLRESFPGRYTRIGLKRVVYTEEYPDIDPYEEDYIFGEGQKIILRTKASCWEYEREYRLILGCKGPNSERRRTIPPEAIAVVIFGYRMSQEHEDEVRRVLSERNLRPVLKKARPEEYSFGLRLEHID